MEYILLNRQSFELYMEEFAQLYETCFGQKMTVKELQWRYLNNPYEEVLACIAVDKGRMVANYAASPMRIAKDGNVFKAALSLNTMTHPDYTGRGLFVELAETLYNSMRNNGYQMTIGFPNSISNRIFLTKLDWRDIYEIPTLKIKLQNLRIEDIGISVIEDNEWKLDYEKLFCTNSELMQIQKSNKYLKWYYKNNAVKKYRNCVLLDGDEVLAVLVWKQYQNIINIVEYRYQTIENLEQLIKQFLMNINQIETDTVTTWGKLGGEEHLLFEKLGFYNDSPVTYFGGLFWDEGTKVGHDYNAWKIFMADDNVY